MDVERTMTREVVTCRPGDTLARAAACMRERDCGSLPVVERDGQVVGMLTDRDTCMAALALDRPLSAICVREAMSHDVVALAPGQSLAAAAELMGEFQVRRLPVLDELQRPVGLISLVDLALRSSSGEVRDESDVGMDDVATALAGIGRPAPRPLFPTARPGAPRPTRRPGG